MRPQLALTAAALILSACVSQDITPFPAAYDPAAASERSPDDRYTVVYRGSPDMPASEVLDLALLRASTITLQKEGDWFEVVTDYSRTDTRKETAFQADPFARRVQQTANCGVLGCTTSATPVEGSGDIERIRESRPFVTQSLEIVVHYGEMPVGADGYDAVATSESIRARYQRDED
ncbi:MAG: hypothetical protein AAF292_01310 [Pseudomonadota bacterium]